jgi:glycerophosphoryl diester phosphodiesterase
MRARQRAAFALAASLVAFAGACGMTRPRADNTAVPRPRFLVAHRGAHLAQPENSLQAIRDAGRFGATHAEVDVRTTRDGELVLMHDGAVDRTTNGQGSIAELGLGELRQLTLELRDGTPSTEPVPTFAEALEAAAQANVGLYVDVKDVTAEQLVRALRGIDARRVLVYESDFDWLDRLHALAPAVPILAECKDADEIREAVTRFGTREFASTYNRFSPELAAAAHAVGGSVIVDVLGLDMDLEGRILDAVRRGADGIQTDDAARVRALFDRSER